MNRRLNDPKPHFLSLTVSTGWVLSLCIALLGQAFWLFRTVDKLGTAFEASQAQRAMLIQQRDANDTRLEHRIERLEDRLDHK